jgi:hypothetical protein
VYQFVKDNAKTRGWNIPNLITFKENDTEELNKWHLRGYLSIVGIKISNKFYDDAKDGIINNYEDYKNYT